MLKREKKIMRIEQGEKKKKTERGACSRNYGFGGDTGKCGTCKRKVTGGDGDILNCVLCYRAYHVRCNESDGFLCEGCLMKQLSQVFFVN